MSTSFVSGFDGLSNVSQGDKAVFGDSVEGNSGMAPASSFELYSFLASSALMAFEY